MVRRLKAKFRGIGERYGFEIDMMEVNEDHVHFFRRGVVQGVPND